MIIKEEMLRSSIKKAISEFQNSHFQNKASASYLFL